ncbi:MAG: hypothetical protein J6K29_00200 [Clostridia bacterium]|nr:hypothetical protein [Clostridia bacterium]
MMKRHTYKRLLALFLSLLMILTSLSALLTVSVVSVSAAVKKEHSVQNGTGTREPIRAGESYAYRANVKYAFNAFGFNMPTWNQTDSSCTVSVYKWQGSFESTVAGQPIASKRFDPMVDGNCNWVTFDPQPAGEYLFHISDASYDAGVWTNTVPEGSKGFLYLNGKEQRGEPELQLRFTEAVEDPYGDCEPSQDAHVVVSPYNSMTDEGIHDLNQSVGMRLTTTVPVRGMEVKFGTYYMTDLEVSMSVFAWKGTYEETVKAAPVATSRVTLVDNKYAGVEFPKIPAGDYLFMVHDMTATPALYIYKQTTGLEGLIYLDGYTYEGAVGYPAMRIICAAETDDYFTPCTATDDLPDGTHTPPEPYVIPSDSLIYTHPVMPDTWVFTDGLGRVSLTNAEVGDLKEDKTLAMFYWTWHISGSTSSPVYNMQELSAKYPEAMRDYDNPLWAEMGSFIAFWNEPVYGFYRSDDGWVQRRQGELLANAGVDVIFTDNTNGTNTWRNAYTSLMNTWSDAMADGVKTPKVSFMLPFWDRSNTNTQVQSLYLDIFRAGKWPELWFYWDKKPMLMGIKDSFDPNASLTDKEIASFFTFRAPQPSYLIEKTDYANWGWLSMYPQEVYYKNQKEEKAGIVEQITVGIAQNHDYKHHLLAAMSGNNITGRSYTTDYENRFDVEGAEASKWGYNFAQQWSYALEVNPRVVFVTGWNEWKAGRYELWPEEPENPAAVENAFPDTYIDEFSRDIEPTKGALQDHYYYQLVNFVRQYKGARPIPVPTAQATIDLNGSIDQWNQVGPYYAAYIGNTDDRDAVGYGNIHYTETSGRNDIIGAKIARDGEYVYFMVECAENITPYTDALWMNLYIDTDQEKQGWNTFEFVVNKTAASEKTLVLEKFTDDNDYAKTEKVADVEYKVDGKYMTVKIAKSDLGLSGDDYTVNFAWTDNVHDEGDYERFSGDILDFYISGDVAPGGRFKFSYISTAANSAMGETDETTPSESTPVETPAETEPDTQPRKKGCKSTLGMGVAFTLTAMAAAVALKKSKED